MPWPTYLMCFFSPSLRMSGWLGQAGYLPLPAICCPFRNYSPFLWPSHLVSKASECWTRPSNGFLLNTSTRHTTTLCRNVGNKYPLPQRHAPEEWIAQLIRIPNRNVCTYSVKGQVWTGTGVTLTGRLLQSVVFVTFLLPPVFPLQFRSVDTVCDKMRSESCQGFVQSGHSIANIQCCHISWESAAASSLAGIAQSVLRAGTLGNKDSIIYMDRRFFSCPKRSDWFWSLSKCTGHISQRAETAGAWSWPFNLHIVPSVEVSGAVSPIYQSCPAPLPSLVYLHGTVPFFVNFQLLSESKKTVFMQIPAFVSVHKIATCARPHPPHTTVLSILPCTCTPSYSSLSLLFRFFKLKTKNPVTLVCYWPPNFRHRASSI